MKKCLLMLLVMAVFLLPSCGPESWGYLLKPSTINGAWDVASQYLNVAPDAPAQVFRFAPVGEIVVDKDGSKQIYTGAVGIIFGDDPLIYFACDVLKMDAVAKGTATYEFNEVCNRLEFYDKRTAPSPITPEPVVAP